MEKWRAIEGASVPEMNLCRRDFLKLGSALGFFGTPAPAAGELVQWPPTMPSGSIGTGFADRTYWCSIASRLANPVLDALSHRRLKVEMPIEAQSNDRSEYAHLEALAGHCAVLLPGSSSGDGSDEGNERHGLPRSRRAAIDAATDPRSPDFISFSVARSRWWMWPFLHTQCCAPQMSFGINLNPHVQANTIDALKASRSIQGAREQLETFCDHDRSLRFRAGQKPDEARLLEGINRFHVGIWAMASMAMDPNFIGIITTLS